jgi:hypothetical protein
MTLRDDCLDQRIHNLLILLMRRQVGVGSLSSSSPIALAHESYWLSRGLNDLLPLLAVVVGPHSLHLSRALLLLILVIVVKL